MPSSDLNQVDGNYVQFLGGNLPLFSSRPIRQEINDIASHNNDIISHTTLFVRKDLFDTLFYSLRKIIYGIQTLPVWGYFLRIRECC